MRSHAVRQALSRRLRTLDRNLPAVLEDDAEALHRTRVASRRLREALPVFSVEGPGAQSHSRDLRKSKESVRQLTRALGKVRELDVALVILDDIAHRHPELADAASATRAAIERERTERRAEMARRLDDIRPDKLAKRLSSLVQQAGAEVQADRMDLLRRRLVRRADRLGAAIESAGALYAFDRLHLVRIATKKLRYALELVQELAGVRTLRLAKRLKQTQDLLGHLHDLEIVAGFVRREFPGSAGNVAAGAGPLLGLIERETRELHAAYLGRVRALGDVIATCREDIDRRLAPPAASRAAAK
jgi:CHAD domain-containing protein